jgi:hypothetical protein
MALNTASGKKIKKSSKYVLKFSECGRCEYAVDK